MTQVPAKDARRSADEQPSGENDAITYIPLY